MKYVEETTLLEVGTSYEKGDKLEVETSYEKGDKL